MAQTQDFKCPRCGGKLEFDAATQKMLCPYCDSSFDPAEVGMPVQKGSDKKANADAGWNHDGKELDAQEAEALQAYLCKSCGGEIICDENTAATACPFCGNPVVLSGRVSGVHLRDYALYRKFIGRNPANYALGDGVIDFNRIVEAAKKAGATYGAIEQNTKHPYSEIAKSVAHLQKIGYGEEMK